MRRLLGCRAPGAGLLTMLLGLIPNGFDALRERLRPRDGEMPTALEPLQMRSQGEPLLKAPLLEERDIDEAVFPDADSREIALVAEEGADRRRRKNGPPTPNPRRRSSSHGESDIAGSQRFVREGHACAWRVRPARFLSIGARS